MFRFYALAIPDLCFSNELSVTDFCKWDVFMKHALKFETFISLIFQSANWILTKF